MSKKTVWIHKPTWNWQYCTQSGWSFQIGQPRLHVRRTLNRFHYNSGRFARSFLLGEMRVHVFCAKWWIAGSDWVSCGCDDSSDLITRSMARMDGIMLNALTMHEDGWIQRMEFDQAVSVLCEAFDDSGADEIANLFTE